MRILIIRGLAESLLNFRGPLLKTLVAHGHEVTACGNRGRNTVIAIGDQSASLMGPAKARTVRFPRASR